MQSKLVTKEITNIIANYLYGRPFRGRDGIEVTSNKEDLGRMRNVTRPLDLYMRSYFNSHKYLGGS